jgi:Domain of unknown function (DUF1996)
LAGNGATCLFEAGTKAATTLPEFGASGGNFSGYWIPDLKLRNGTWASGAQVNAYYKKGASSLDPHDIKPFPAKLKILIRDRNNSRTDVRWFCSGLSGEGNNGKFTERPYDCDPTTVHKYVTARITFPQCGNWRLDSTDHIARTTSATWPMQALTDVPRLTRTSSLSGLSRRSTMHRLVPGQCWPAAKTRQQAFTLITLRPGNLAHLNSSWMSASSAE